MCARTLALKSWDGDLLSGMGRARAAAAFRACDRFQRRNLSRLAARRWRIASTFMRATRAVMASRRCPRRRAWRGLDDLSRRSRSAIAGWTGADDPRRPFDGRDDEPDGGGAAAATVRALVLIEPVLVPAKTSVVQSTRGNETGAADRAEKRRDVFRVAGEASKLLSRPRRVQDLAGRDRARLPERRIGAGGRRHAPALPPRLGSGRLSLHAARRLSTRRALALPRDHHPRPTDGTASAGEVAIFQRLYPATRVVPQAGATHFLPMEYPEMVREEIARMVSL